ncbi:MAG: ATP-binding protein [Oscillospiraceae bacterium]|nr:ATP-binding protein [Oscillospiraceae bacterium]
MAYTNTVLNRAKARLRQENERKRSEYEDHLAKAYSLRPRLREIDRALRDSAAQVAALIFRHEGDPAAEIARLRAENEALQAERQWILDEAELPDGYLDDSPVCSLCGGTGYAGSKMCECLRELCRQEQKRELASLLPTGKERFENFSLELYPERFYPELGTSARTLMQKNLNYCKKYAYEFQPGVKSLLFSGATGLGKTFLSACIARQAAESGHSVVYATAGKLFSSFEAVKFERAEPDSLRDYRDCDLLIIDDLGTEMTTQFVTAALYEIVNSRLLDRKATVISTNLNEQDLEARYGGQIASRLLGSYRVVYFLGDDIRRLRKIKQDKERSMRI